MNHQRKVRTLILAVIDDEHRILFEDYDWFISNLSHGLNHSYSSGK